MTKVQNGYAPMATNDAIMLMMTMMMPTQRPTELRLRTSHPASTWTTPMTRTTQPQICRLLTTRSAS